MSPWNASTQGIISEGSGNYVQFPSGRNVGIFLFLRGSLLPHLRQWASSDGPTALMSYGGGCTQTTKFPQQRAHIQTHGLNAHIDDPYKCTNTHTSSSLKWHREEKALWTKSTRDFENIISALLSLVKQTKQLVKIAVIFCIFQSFNAGFCLVGTMDLSNWPSDILTNELWGLSFMKLAVMTDVSAGTFSTFQNWRFNSW